MTNQEIIDGLKAGQLPVIIYGAGIVGKVMLSLCEKNGVKVECFCDGNVKTAQSKFCGLDVIHAPLLKGKYRDARVRSLAGRRAAAERPRRFAACRRRAHRLHEIRAGELHPLP